MRTSAAALVLALLAALGIAAPAAAAPTSVAKVVIIVGPTHGVTDTYRSRADTAYAEARKYTSNVVKVYSPNATWSKVRAAVAGASIIIYFGHGNGWPSPYTNDAAYTTKDGFGLNAKAGAGDANTKYYGEPSVSTLDVAPNAIVLLHHLCYASGNSEPGDAAPSQTTARKRVDNYAAGFLKAGAQAVIADGHMGPATYLRALFTTSQPIEALWRSQPNFHDHVRSFASGRTPGATAYTDTDSASAGYYRSLVARPGLTSDEVVGAPAATGGDPATLAVPGNAQVGTAGGALFADAALAGDGSTALPAGTRLRVVEPGLSPLSVGGSSVRVEGLDDPSIAGYVDAASLLPRDARAPVIWGVDTAGGAFSPNGDGRADVASLTGRFSEPVDWRVRILDGDDVLRTVTGSGTAFAADWDGARGDGTVPDGTYTYEVRADDAWHNGPVTRTGSIAVDTVGAGLASVSGEGAAPWFSPNGDGTRDSVSWTATALEAGSLVLVVRDADGDKRLGSATPVGAGATSVRWDGRDEDGRVVPDGVYDVSISARDATGTPGDPVVRQVRVATTLGFVSSSKAVIYPHDGDKRGRSTTLGFRLARPASVTWTLEDAAGSVVETFASDASMPAGSVGRTFTGRLPDGTLLPKGRYRSVVTATDATTTVSQAAWLEMNAFGVSASDATPARGQRVTITAVSAEKLEAAPKVKVDQPGRSRWSVKTSKVSSGTYRITLTLRSGKAGTVSFKVVGRDAEGHKQSTTLRLPIH